MIATYRKLFSKLSIVLIVSIVITGIIGQSFTVHTYASESKKIGTGIYGEVKNTEGNFLYSTLPNVNYGDQILSLAGLTQNQREDAKAVYDTLTKITPATKQLNVSLKYGYRFSSATDNPTREELAPAIAYVQKVTQTAIDAYLRDYPDVFWIEVESSEWFFTYRYQSTGSYFINQIKSLDYEVGIKKQYSNPSGFYARLQQAVKSFPVTGTTRYDKLKSIHDELCRRNVYADSTYSYQAYGALVDGKSVCEGYGKAFKLICDRENIPCVLVSGTSVNSNGQPEFHMWNYVQMEDGKWYAVDVTWDDGDNRIFYDYFLVGSNTIAPNFWNKTFMESHTEEGDFNLAGYVKFAYPTISKVAYDRNTAIVPTPTPKPVETPKPTATPEPKPARPLPEDAYMYGDADINGVVEAADALLILKKVVRLEVFNGTQQIVSDVDNNWRVEANDALFVLKRVVKLLELFPVEEAND